MDNLLTKWQSIIDPFEKRLGSNTGYLYGLIANLLFAFHDYKIRESAKIPTFQLMFYRGMFDFVCSFAYANINKIPFHYNSKSVNRMLLLRGFVGVTTIFLVFYGFQRADLSEAIALFQIAPVITAILGVAFLKEKCNVVQAVVTLVSIVGALLIVKPNFLFGDAAHVQTVHGTQKMLGNLSVLGSAISFSLAIVLARKMATEDVDPQIGVCYLSPLLCMVVSIGMISQGMKVLSSLEAKNVAILCAVSFVSNYFNFRAVNFGDAGKVILMSYAEIPFGYLLDILFLGYVPELLSTIGVSLIFSCLFIQIFKDQIIGFLFRDGDQKKPTLA